MDGSCRLWFRSALLAGGPAERVRIEARGGLITAIETGADPLVGDERGGLAIPGVPNVHSHSFQRAMAGLTEARGPTDDSFWTWRELMYRFLERLTPDDVEAIAALAFMEMLETGFTRVGEFHYLHNDADGRAFTNAGEMAERIAAAAALTGIGLTLLPVFYAHAGFGGAPPVPGQRRFVSSLDGYAGLLDAGRRAVRDLPDAVVGVAPHSLRAVAPEELGPIVELGQGGPIHIHVAEQTGEVEACLAWSGRRPVEWLFDHAPVDGRWCLIHATHVTGDEQARIVRQGAVVGLCPLTEANLGDGMFPAAEFLQAGGVFGIGTDSNILIDPAQELRALEYGQRLVHRARNVLASGPGQSTGIGLLEGAVAGGAQALGCESGLRIGAPADIAGLGASVDGWIFASARPVVDSVWRRGRKVVADGRHHRRDEIAARYETVLARLLA